MKTYFLILLVAILLPGCRFKTTVDYADSLDSCLTRKDIEVLNVACETFEDQLTKRYPNSATGQAYLDFLMDLAAMDIPPEFFFNTNSKTILHKMISAETFNKIWVRNAQYDTDVEEILIRTTDGKIDDLGEMYDQYVISPSGAFFTCLSGKNKRETLFGYYELIHKRIMLSPALIAHLFVNNLTEEDLDDGLTRLSIAIGLYYDLIVQVP
jgi:hypothetical protein